MCNWGYNPTYRRLYLTPLITGSGLLSDLQLPSGLIHHGECVCNQCASKWPLKKNWSYKWPTYLGGSFNYVLFSPLFWGKIVILTYIFQMGGENHQPDIFAPPISTNHQFLGSMLIFGGAHIIAPSPIFVVTTKIGQFNNHLATDLSSLLPHPQVCSSNSRLYEAASLRLENSHHLLPQAVIVQHAMPWNHACHIHLYYLYIYIYLELKWGPLFWLEFRPCFGGLTLGKLEVSWVLGIFMWKIYQKIHLLNWLSLCFILFGWDGVVLVCWIWLNQRFGNYNVIFIDVFVHVRFYFNIYIYTYGLLCLSPSHTNHLQHSDIPVCLN